ncbi:GNAT family N-acetyltransferase [Listeria seeligeri]|uniref:GNAT family N-acetyltransferase n=1 Tax=Listeria seeligeri TaxID=1640 RepID=UPI0016267926|nr:GNAT family N-acetyltransferase [Listeria seeligeri]MBC1738276.1 GNAT family N-acetyltransferase [Listeria seeligeri]
MPKLTFRNAIESDTELILHYILELAKHEGIEQDVVATEAGLHETLFNQKAAEVIIAEYEGQSVGFALFFHNYSTLLGKKGLYLEDLYIIPEMRGKGFGTQFFAHLSKLALARDCGRFEWWCLNENKSGMDFYEKIGAEQMSEWTVHRLSKTEMEKLSKHIKDVK